MINNEKNIYKNEFDFIFICNDNINLLYDPFNFFYSIRINYFKLNEKII